MKALAQSHTISKDRPMEQVIPITAEMTVSGKEVSLALSQWPTKNFFRTKNGTVFIRRKKKVHNTQGIIVFQMFYEIFIFFNMLNIFKLAKIKVPLKCDYTFLLLFCSTSSQGSSKNDGSKLAEQILTNTW